MEIEKQPAQGNLQTSVLFVNKYEFLLKWYHAATLELIGIHGPGLPIPQMAAYLEITTEQVEEALKCLLSLGMISKTASGFSRNNKLITAESSTPSPVIKNFHRQILDQAKIAIDETPINERKNLSAVFSFDSSRMQEAREWIAAKHQEFLNEFGNTKNADRVYSVSTHLIPVDRGLGENV